MNNIFICGGRTGGPLFPMLALSKQLDLKDRNDIIIGIKNGFEEQYANQKNFQIEFLPEAKLSILSFKPTFTLYFIKQIFSTFYAIILLKISFIKCLHLILKYKPKLILNAGGFVSVPLIYANTILKLFRLSKTKVVVHQQDPLMGLANKLTFRFADIKSYVFDYTKDKYNLKNAIKISNPTDYTKFQNLGEYQNSQFKEIFQSNNNKKNIFITGGGSGSKVLNDWTYNNLDALSKYNIINLTGLMQTQEDQEKWQSKNNNQVYFTESTIDDFPKLLLDADLIITRAGLGTITEINFIEKKSILIPMLFSHQELNAELAGERFLYLKEDAIDELIHLIDKSISDRINQTDIEESIDKYKKLNSNYINKVLSII